MTTLHTMLLDFVAMMLYALVEMLDVLVPMVLMVLMVLVAAAAVLLRPRPSPRTSGRPIAARPSPTVMTVAPPESKHVVEIVQLLITAMLARAIHSLIACWRVLRP